MEPIYIIQNGLGQQDNSLSLFSDRILIRKPNERSSSAFDVIKKELRLQGIIKTEYIGIDVPFSKIDSIYLKLATSAVMKNGLIVFYLKDRAKNEVNMFNYASAANAMKFWSQDNETAQAIKEYVEAHIATQGSTNTSFSIDADSCLCCGSCSDVCPMGAIDIEGISYAIDSSLCVECGICATTCPIGAIN